MKAVVWHGKADVRVDTVPDPRLEQPTDAIVRITSTAICGSDLHLYANLPRPIMRFVPAVPIGEIFDRQRQIRVGPGEGKAVGRRHLPLLTDDDPLGTEDLTTHVLPLEQAP